MSTRLIRITGTTGKFQQVVPLEGETYTFLFRWNARASRWFLTIRDDAGADLITGKKIVADVPFHPHETNENLPPGQIRILDVSGEGADPGLRDLGKRVVLMYVDEDNVA
jgi:hypothetical protein